MSGIPRKHVHSLQRLHSLAFSIGTFACAKDQASSLLDGLLKENPTPCSHEIFGLIPFTDARLGKGLPAYTMTCPCRLERISPINGSEKIVLTKHGSLTTIIYHPFEYAVYQRSRVPEIRALSNRTIKKYLPVQAGYTSDRRLRFANGNGLVMRSTESLPFLSFLGLT